MSETTNTDPQTEATGTIAWRKLLNIALMGALCYVFGLLYCWSAGAGWALASKLAIGSTIPWLVGNLQRTGGIAINLPEVKAALTK